MEVKMKRIFVGLLFALPFGLNGMLQDGIGTCFSDQDFEEDFFDQDYNSGRVNLAGYFSAEEGDSGVQDPDELEGLLDEGVGFAAPRSQVEDVLTEQEGPGAAVVDQAIAEGGSRVAGSKRRGEGSREKKRAKKHVCDWCSRTFAYRYDLRAHERTHTGEKPLARLQL